MRESEIDPFEDVRRGVPSRGYRAAPPSEDAQGVCTLQLIEASQPYYRSNNLITTCSTLHAQRHVLLHVNESFRTCDPVVPDHGLPGNTEETGES